MDMIVYIVCVVKIHSYGPWRIRHGFYNNVINLKEERGVLNISTFC